MAIDFPNSPTNGQTYTVGDTTWIYQNSVWNILSSSAAYSICTSTTRPSAPGEGRMIYETDTNKALFYNGTSWVETVDLDNAGGISDSMRFGHVVCTSSTRPSTNLSEGFMIYETDTDKVLMYNGSAWIVVNWLGTWPSFHARKTTVKTTGAEIIVFDNEVEDLGSNYSTTTGKFTAPVTGIYSFSASTIADVNQSRWFFQKNATDLQGPTPYTSVTAGYTTLSASLQLKLDANDTMCVYSPGGMFYGASSGDRHNHFSGTLIRPV